MMKKYLITSPESYSSLEQQLGIHTPEYVLFRDKVTKSYKKESESFVALCKAHKKVKTFLHQDSDLAKELGADGVHLTSLQFDKIVYAKELGLEVIISTHTHKEVLKAEKLGVDGVTYSPIFTSPGKGKPKGLKDLESLLEKSSVKVFALGGIISSKEVDSLADINPYGFASIRYFI